MSNNWYINQTSHNLTLQPNVYTSIVILQAIYTSKELCMTTTGLSWACCCHLMIFLLKSVIKLTKFKVCCKMFSLWFQNFKTNNLTAQWRLYICTKSKRAVIPYKYTCLRLVQQCDTTPTHLIYFVKAVCCHSFIYI